MYSINFGIWERVIDAGEQGRDAIELGKDACELAARTICYRYLLAL